MKQKNIFISQYYLSAFFTGLEFIVPFLLIMLNKTLTPAQISLLIIINSITKIVFEIPSGSLADKYGKKSILITGIFLYIIGLFTLFISKEFHICILIYTIWGISDSLISGTELSLFYNNMKYYKIDNKYPIYNGKYSTIKSLTAASTAFISSFLFKTYGYNFLIISQLLLSGFCYIFLILTIKNHEIKEKERNLEIKQLEIIKKGFKYLLNNKVLFKIFAFMSLISSFLLIFKEYNELFLSEIVEKVSTVGILDSIEHLIIASGEFFLVYIFLKFKFKWNVSLLFAASITFLISFISYNFPISYILNVIFWTFTNIIMIVLDGKQQEYIPSSIRATIISFSSLCSSVFKILFLYVFGIISNICSYQISFIIFASIQICLIIIFLPFFLKENRI